MIAMFVNKQTTFSLHLLKRIFHPPVESPDYQAWKQKLFRDRLIISFWVLLVCWIAFAIRDFSQVYNPEFTQIVIEKYSRQRIEFFRARAIYSYSVIAFIFVVCSYRLKKDRFKYHINLIFLGLAFSLTLFPLVVCSFLGEPDIRHVLNWGLIFLGLAILIPVRWQIHLISQLGLIIYYLVAMPILGTLNLIEVDINRVFFPDTLIPLLLVCPISILAISMYERSQQKEFESRRELKVFLHSVTHDLQTPVMASSIVLENLLQQPGKKLTVDRSVIERLRQGSDRTFKIVDSLIGAYNTEANGVVLNLQPCSIKNLVDSVLIDLQPVISENQAIVDNRIAANLPDLRADPIQIWRVLNNLIANALKHNPNYIQITIDAMVRDNSLYCTVSDNGVGISAEQGDRLFKLYSRGKRSRYMPGLGIGLYLCQQIIEAHGGKIGIVSNSGNGSTFWFTLPLERKLI